MARTNVAEDMGADAGFEPTWTQPKRFVAVSLVDRGRGIDRRFPVSPVLETIAREHGGDVAASVMDMMLSYAKAAATAAAGAKDVKPEDEVSTIDSVLEQVANGTFGDVSEISGRDDFNRALLIRSRDALVSALKARNIDPTDTNVSKAFKANYEALIELHGDEVAAAGFTPTKKTKGGNAATAGVVDLGNLFS